MGHKPSAPTYNKQAALAEQNRLNQAAGLQTYANLNSPMGGYSVTVDPNTGKMSVTKNLSENSLMAMAAQANALDKFVADPTRATKEYYDMQMAYIQPQFDAQIDAAQADMINRGIRPGSSAWNQTMANIDNAQDRAKTEIANNALFNGQQYQTNMLSQAASAGNMVVDPALIEAAKGAGLYDTYDKKWQNEQDIYKSQMARYNANLKAIVNPLGDVAGSLLGMAGSAGSGGTNKAAGAANTYKGAVTNDGMYGAWAGTYFG